MSISDPVIAYLRTRVGSIKESNIRWNAQMVETTRMVADHRWILAEKSKILVVHDQRIAFQDQNLADTKSILRPLSTIQGNQ